MFDVHGYLRHLGHTGSLAPTVDTLRSLHKKHLMTVPFDNALNASKGLAVWDEVDIDLDAMYEELIVKGRGGVCHELAGLMRGLLLRLGYDVVIMSGGVRGAGGEFGPELEHMFNVVRFADESWIVDVGFAGPSFIEPLRLSGEVQSQYGFDYRVVVDSAHHVVERRKPGADWLAVYRFQVQERDLDEWKGISSGENDDPGWHWAGEMIAVGTLVRGRAFDNGQHLLVGRRHLKAVDGREEIRVLAKEADYNEVVAHILRRDG